MKLRTHALNSLATGLVLILGVPASAAENGAADAGHSQAHEVVATGLDNPRGLHAVGDVIYVAESGTGGDELKSAVTVVGQTVFACVGQTGAVTRLDENGPTRLATFPSQSPPQMTPDGPVCPGTGSSARGPADITSVGPRSWWR